MRAIITSVIVVALAGSAAADKPSSLAHYETGKRAYAAGKFELAIDEFQLAYRELPAPEYLHDIAQAMRRLGRCADALTYFQRFLVAKPNASTRPAVEAQIAALHTQCPAGAPAPAPPPPTPAVTPPRVPVQVAAAPPPPRAHESEPPAIVAVAPAVEAPSRWSVGVLGGVVALGAGPVVVPPIAQARVSAGYLVTRGVRVGASLDLARLPYDDRARGTVWLGGVQAAIDGTYPISDRLAIIGSAGAGTRTAWGFTMGNPFIAGGGASSAITMLVIRGELGVTWRLAPRTSLRVLPLALQYSPRRAPLAADIGSLHGLAVLAGIDVEL